MQAAVSHVSVIYRHGTHSCITLGIVRWVPQPRTWGWVVQKLVNQNLGLKWNVGVSGTWFQTVLWKQPKVKLRKKRGSALELTRICSLENNAFPVLHYVIKVTSHYLMLRRFGIHSDVENLELSPTALLCNRLAKTGGCSLAVKVTYWIHYYVKSIKYRNIPGWPFNVKQMLRRLVLSNKTIYRIKHHAFACR